MTEARFLPVSKSWVRRLLKPIVPAYFWMTYRLPFQKVATITFPDGSFYPDDGIVSHELVHVQQLKPWYGPWLRGAFALLLPLPVLFSGRWFNERPAYLQDIKMGRCSVEEAVDTLWIDYGYAWPRKWMKKWFEEQLAKDGSM